NRSTKHAITILIDDVRTGMDQGQLTGSVFMDMRKAFDTVNHGHLLDKLPAYGIKDIEMKWLTSYLFARAQVVNFKGTLSDKKTITHGVPQGSILGPLLFALLINDLHTEVTECKILLYADDTVVYFSHRNISQLETIVNEEVNKIAKWMSENHLTLNLKKGKTEFLLFGSAKRLGKESSSPINIKINGEHLNQTTQYKYLGVLLDHHLTLHEQVRTVYHKTSTRLKLLKRVRHNLTTYAAERVYLNMIQPIITYCPAVYLGLRTYLKEKLQSVQDRGKKIVLSKQTDVKWKSISEIINQKTLLDVHKAIQRASPPVFHEFFTFLNHGKNTRGHAFIALQFSTLSLIKA
ncbi:Hypothetical predicted protein, partial [Paramuricea clavata]